MTIKNVIGELIGYLILIVFAFGWLDTLWIFGVENSQLFFVEGDIESPHFVEKVSEKNIDNGFVVPSH